MLSMSCRTVKGLRSVPSQPDWVNDAAWPSEGWEAWSDCAHLFGHGDAPSTCASLYYEGGPEDEVSTDQVHHPAPNADAPSDQLAAPPVRPADVGAVVGGTPAPGMLMCSCSRSCLSPQVRFVSFDARATAPATATATDQSPPFGDTGGGDGDGDGDGHERAELSADPEAAERPVPAGRREVGRGGGGGGGRGDGVAADVLGGV